MQDTVAVILGGGKGTRLYPLTRQRSKPAVPFAGKFRLIDVPISNCINSGLKRIFVLTQYNSESLNRHINTTYRFDQFSRAFVSLLAAEQTSDNYGWFQGTADALRQMWRHIKSAPNQYVLILSGDQLYRMNYQQLIDFHKKTKAHLTISAIPVTPSEAVNLGILAVDKEDKILSITEKPNPNQLENLKNKHLSEEKPFYGSMGIYLFNSDYLAELLKANLGHDLVRDIISFIIRDNKAYAYHFEGFWADIGTIRSFYNVNLSLTDYLPTFSLYNTDYPIYTHSRMLPDAKVHNSQIYGAIISEGAIIDSSKIIRSIIGIRSVIKSGSHIESSIIMGSDYYEIDYTYGFTENLPHLGIGENCYLKNCIIDKNVRIGKDVKIINKNGKDFEKSEKYFIKDGIVIIPKDTVIPNGTII